MRNPGAESGLAGTGDGPPHRTRRIAWLAAAALLLPAAVLSAESTATLRSELSGADAENFAVENLAGTMRIEAADEGTAAKVVVVATVHAESDELARGVRLERIAGDPAVLRVRYPAGVRTVRYRQPNRHGEVSVTLDLFSSTSVDYDGKSYRVAPGHGKRVWADVEVRVPARLGRARFRNLVGFVEANGFEGKLAFDVSTADLELSHLSGDVALEGSSGDTRAADIRGRLRSEFSSGDLALENFDGDALSFRTSSGDVRGSGIKATRVDVDTSSGDVSLSRADIEEYAGESSSGDLRLEVEGSRLRELRAHTSSGDVTLRLPSDASFEADADQSSGDMEVGFSDGASTLRHDKVVSYRRGTGAARIRVETSSGDLSILPRRPGPSAN